VGQTRWLVGVLVGLALATVGLRPARRAVTWVVALATVWVLDAAITALANITVLLRPGSGLPDTLREATDAGRDAFVQALLAHRPGPLALAVVIGLAGSLLVPRLRPEGEGPRGHGPTAPGPTDPVPTETALSEPAPSEPPPAGLALSDALRPGPTQTTQRSPEPAGRHTDDAAAR
jgi:hypothetical protein